MSIGQCLPGGRTVAISIVRLCIGGGALAVASHMPESLAKIGAFVGHAFLFLAILTPFAHIESVIVGGFVDRMILSVRPSEHVHSFGEYFESARDSVVHRCVNCGTERQAI